MLMILIVIHDHFEAGYIKVVIAINVLSIALDVAWFLFYEV